MTRRGDRRIGGLPGAQCDFRLRPFHQRSHFRFLAPGLSGIALHPLQSAETRRWEFRYLRLVIYDGGLERQGFGICGWPYQKWLSSKHRYRRRDARALLAIHC